MVLVWTAACSCVDSPSCPALSLSGIQPCSPKASRWKLHFQFFHFWRPLLSEPLLWQSFKLPCSPREPGCDNQLHAFLAQVTNKQTLCSAATAVKPPLPLLWSFWENRSFPKNLTKGKVWSESTIKSSRQLLSKTVSFFKLKVSETTDKKKLNDAKDVT